MIDICSYLWYFTKLSPDKNQPAPLLCCAPKWFSGKGEGIAIGLIDSDIDIRIPDINTTNITIRNFTESQTELTAEHGTYSAALIIGQGIRHIRGIAPMAHLLVANVIGPKGIAKPNTVEKAIRWLISERVNIVVMPIGDDKEHHKIANLIERGSKKGTLFFASAGNWHPQPVSFPACHPLVIAVGAANNFGRILADCSRFPRLDLLAPGWKISAPVSERSIRSASGTSVACVMAAGAAALVLSTQDFSKCHLREDILNELSGGMINT